MSLPLSTFHFAPLQSSLQEIVAEWRDVLEDLSPATKSAVRRWRSDFALSLDQMGLADEVTEWFSDCLHCDARLLGAEDILTLFCDVQWLHSTGQMPEMGRLFLAMQNTVSRLMFNQGEPHNLQHNLLEEMSTCNALENSVDSLNDLDEPEDADEDSQSASSLHSESATVTWPDFQEIAKPQGWVRALVANRHLWGDLCSFWDARLREGFSHGRPSPASNNARHGVETVVTSKDPYYCTIVEVLREMRRVPARVYRSVEWADAVRRSNLPSAIMIWSDSRALALWRSPLMERLLRFHRINYTLFFVLWNWIPTTHILKEEEPSLSSGLLHRAPHKVKSSLVLRHGRAVFKFLNDHPEVIPLSSSPSSAFFLLSEENFLEAWGDWFLCATQEAGYDASRLYDGGVLKKGPYRHVLEALSERAKRGFDVIENSRLRVILERSWQFRKLKDELAPRGGGVLNRINRSNVTTPCDKCRSRPNVEEHCVQNILVTAATPDTALAGCGISAHPLHDVIEPSQLQAGDTSIRPLLHLERDLGLTLIRCDEAVIRRCGSQTFRLIDQQTGELRDFWVYNAFSDTSFRTLQQHVQRFGSLKRLVRGRQFATFSHSRMCPLGERTASGGSPGDSHRFYDGMSAQSEDALHCLFDNAEDSLTLSEVTRLVAPNLYQQIRKLTRDGEKIGLDASTLYYCTNYAAPLHFDNDATPGVCAMLELEAGEGDYCFVNLAYGYRFAPRANSFWSFRGTDLHGTSLPPLRLQGGKSCTLHVTKNNKNAQAASRYSKARRVRDSVEKFWEGS